MPGIPALRCRSVFLRPGPTAPPLTDELVPLLRVFFASVLNKGGCLSSATGTRSAATHGNGLRVHLTAAMGAP
eukprot:277869-Prorocentrum_minimum.AAC.2